MLKKWMEEEEQEAEVEQGAQQGVKQKEPEKKKKGIFRWMFRKKKNDCNSQVKEEAAGCAAQDGQQ